MLRRYWVLYGRHTAIMKPGNAHRMRKPFTIDIDREESYDAPAPTQASTDLSEFLEFFNDPSNKKKYMFNTNLERELLFYFDKISDEDKKEIIEFTKIKARKPL